jgi:hypothetical protein
MMRASGVQASVARIFVCGAQCVSCVSVKKMPQVPDRTMDVSDVNLELDLTYSEYPIRILDQKDRVTRKRTIKFYKVQWHQHTEDEATWESEEYLKEHFLEFLVSCKP